MDDASRGLKNRPLWICPDCGARLASRNLWHSCGTFTFDDLFTRTTDTVTDAARALISACQQFGDIQVLPQKTRLVLVARVRFSSLVPRKNSVIVGFALHRWIDHPRIEKTDDFGSRWRYHYVRMTDASGVDAELLGWMRESYDVVGQRADLPGRNAGGSA
jgi:Domain of unknown function (DUF5655)